MMGHREEKGLYLLAAQHLFTTLRAQGLQLQVGAAPGKRLKRKRI
jgi:hypothetical protein